MFQTSKVAFSKAQGSTMPVRIVGMIGVTPPSNDTTLHVIEGGLSPSYLAQFARAHDDADFDLALVGHTSSSAEGFLVALYAAGHTNRLGYLAGLRCADIDGAKDCHLRPPHGRKACRAYHHG